MSFPVSRNYRNPSTFLTESRKYSLLPLNICWFLGNHSKHWEFKHNLVHATAGNKYFFTEFRKRYVLNLSVFWESLKSEKSLPWGTTLLLKSHHRKKHCFEKCIYGGPKPSKMSTFEKVYFHHSEPLEKVTFLKVHCFEIS